MANDFKDEGVDDDVKTFVLKDIDDSHPARPKPLFKTHKLDDDGNLIKPVKIRKAHPSIEEKRPT